MSCKWGDSAYYLRGDTYISGRRMFLVFHLRAVAWRFVHRWRHLAWSAYRWPCSSRSQFCPRRSGTIPYDGCFVFRGWWVSEFFSLKTDCLTYSYLRLNERRRIQETQKTSRWAVPNVYYRSDKRHNCQLFCAFRKLCETVTNTARCCKEEYELNSEGWNILTDEWFSICSLYV